MVDYHDLSPVIERILLFSWLCKDFGWMTTNIYLGFPFGFISVSVHFLLMLFDPRKSYRFYNVSLFFWVAANFLWMTIEFTSTNPSSHIHVGPAVPIGGISNETASKFGYIKTTFFSIAATVQIIMYIGIYNNVIEMPEDMNDEPVSKNEAQALLYGVNTPLSKHSELKVLKGEIAAEDHSQTISLAFIENAYIIFWISKDLFWSWGTGDLTRARNQVIFYESTAMFFGTLSILIYCITAYLYRRNIVTLIDSITTICWIGANYVWMCGEFFLRYDNLLYDDTTEHDDSKTRVASAILFCIGILLQCIVVLYLSFQKYGISLPCFKSRRNQEKYQIEMFTFGPIAPSLVAIEDKKSRSAHISLGSQESYADDEEQEIMF